MFRGGSRIFLRGGGRIEKSFDENNDLFTIKKWTKLNKIESSIFCGKSLDDLFDIEFYIFVDLN